MRNTIINAIHEKAKNDKNIVFLTADLWYSVIENFQRELPEQCINIGIAEQNMVWIAAWLALTGKKVFCYSIVPFVTMRCYEQIRVDLCYQNLDVTLIGVWWWFAYGTLWSTHYGIEDINIMKWLPNMKVLSPADKIEVVWSLNYVFNNSWPLYIRLNRWWERDIHEKLWDFNIENWITIKQWNDVVLISTGNILEEVIKASKILEDNNVSTKIISIPLVKPINSQTILDAMKWKNAVFTIEEHTVVWWLWDSVASIVAENNVSIKFKKIWIPDTFYYIVWNQEYMRKLVWIDGEGISNTILQIIK